MAIVGVLAVIALVGGLVAVVQGGDDDPDVPAATDEDAGAGPTATTVPPDPPTEAELRAVVDEVSAFVEQERGLTFEEPVAAELVADEEFERRALEDFEEEVPSLETAGVVLAALGLVDPDLDVVEATRSLTGAGVVGFYDPESGELVVRGAALTPYVRTVMAHELTHALDDQHFELDRPELDEAADESGFGFLSVVEGNARRVETAYRDALSDEESRRALAEELALASGIDITSIPFVLVEQLSAPYELGQDFVDALLEAGGQEQLDAALDAPPTTSEQVLHPEAYLAGEGAVEVPLPEGAGEVVDDGTLGEFLIAGVLRGALDGDEVTVATDGWGGDRAVAWRDGGRPCVTASVVGDTPEDTAELQAAFEEWATARDDATVDAGAAPDAPFTLRACA